MDGPTPTRKSGRGRIPNKKYSIDAFEGLDILDSDTERNAVVSELLDDTDVDQDFKNDIAAEEAEATDTDVISVDEVSDGSAIATAADDYEDAASYASEIEVLDRPETNIEKHTSQPVTQTNSQPSPSKKPKGNLEHFRGVPEPVTYNKKRDHMRYIFGGGTKDLLQVMRSREQWANNPTLPNRSFIEQGRGGLAFSFSHTAEKRHMEATAGWQWYYKHSGQASFAQQQRTVLLEADNATQYMSRPRADSHSFLMGPYGKQKIFNLAIGQSLNTAQAWESEDVAENPSQVSELSGNGDTSERTSWMLNIGNKIRCLDWAANHEDTQYLAVASGCLNPITSTTSASAPAFTPSARLPAHFQIWAFHALVQRDEASYICASRHPVLRLVCCTKWGDIRHLKWCHVPRTTHGEERLSKIPVGLLAGIWGDGYVRVLDIQLDKESSSTTYVRLENAAFEARPQNTVCTCLAWLSATDIAVGCANGTVVIYNIHQSAHSHDTLDPTCPIPWFSHQLHQTYVLAIASAYPSHPHLLATSSMDGYLRLTDLRSPSTDSVFSHRSRMGSTVLAYCDALLSFISCDENDYMRIYPMRRFFSTINCARASSSVLSLAVGHFHPTVLLGCADGSVMATNPMRRTLNAKLKPYQQVVMKHEWTRGMSRITEGYKCEAVYLGHVKNGKERTRDGTLYSTVYEEESAATQVAWNRNLRCGGWVAIGMGSGLVRVMDVAI